MRLFRVLSSLALLSAAFLLAIPPIQSSANGSIEFLPMGLVATGLFVAACLVEPRSEPGSVLYFSIIMLKSTGFFGFAWLVFERVSAGMLS